MSYDSLTSIMGDFSTEIPCSLSQWPNLDQEKT